jgi:hypothetical protein
MFDVTEYLAGETKKYVDNGTITITSHPDLDARPPATEPITDEPAPDEPEIDDEPTEIPLTAAEATEFAIAAMESLHVLLYPFLFRIANYSPQEYKRALLLKKRFEAPDVTDCTDLEMQEYDAFIAFEVRAKSYAETLKYTPEEESRLTKAMKPFLKNNGVKVSPMNALLITLGMTEITRLTPIGENFMK